MIWSISPSLLFHRTLFSPGWPQTFQIAEDNLKLLIFLALFAAPSTRVAGTLHRDSVLRLEAWLYVH